MKRDFMIAFLFLYLYEKEAFALQRKKSLKFKCPIEYIFMINILFRECCIIKYVSQSQ